MQSSMVGGRVKDNSEFKRGVMISAVTGKMVQQALLEAQDTICNISMEGGTDPMAMDCSD